MPQELVNNHLLLNEIWDLNGSLKAAGHPEDSLVSISDGLLSYLLSLLREEQPIFPQKTVDEWSGLFSHLVHHGIVPLLYSKIRDLSVELHPPEAITTRMREAFLLSRARCLRMERQLGEILGEFERNGINAVVIRGPALAWSVYPDPAIRPSVDIDLLVKPGQYLQARDVLNYLGYRCPYKRFETFRQLYNSESFVRKQDARKLCLVDLHWSIFQYHGLWRDNGTGTFFDRKLKVQTPALTFETLETLDALILAAFHLIVHHPEGRRLIWVSDIALLARSLSGSEEWEALFERARAYRLSLALCKALDLARFCFGIEIPETCENSLKRLDHLKDEEGELNFAVNRQGRDIRLKGYFDSFRSSPNKFRFLMRFLFPEPGHMRATYPTCRGWLFPLSYMRRWGRWAGKVVQYGLHVRSGGQGA